MSQAMYQELKGNDLKQQKNKIKNNQINKKNKV
jgi:hypothetical protein